MHRSIGRIAALLGAGALALAAVSPVAAAEPLEAVLTDNDLTAVTAGSAAVRVLHGSPDTPSVDVYVGADLATAAKVDALSGAVFGDITGYVEVPAGTYAVKVCATADPTLCPIEIPSLALAADTRYTVAASGLLADIQATPFVDDPQAPAGQALVRVIHLSADTPAVDVLTQAGDSIGIDGLTYPNRAPATGYAPFPAGSYDLKVCASADNTLCPIDPPALPLAADTAYTVFAIGSLAATLPAETPAPEAEATPPATSTVAPTTDGGASTGNLLAVLGLLGIAGIATVGMSRRFATRRVEM